MVENTKKLEPLIIIDVRTDWNRNINWSSNMDRVNNIDSFEVSIRKRIIGFTERLNNCENTIIKCINNSWVLRFDIWIPWNELFFI